MSIVVNTNVSATTASFNLSLANDSLRKSLARLSSGKRIVSPADDAGDLAVAYKLSSSLNCEFAARLRSADNDMFATPGGNLGVQDVWDGTGGSFSPSDSGLRFEFECVPVPTGVDSGSGSSGPLSTAVENDEVFTDDGFLYSIMFVSVGQFTSVIERIADARAENGAEQSRLNMSSELLTHKQTNSEAAQDRVMDADIALESTRFARRHILVQASAAMTAQANHPPHVDLTLLG